MEKSAPALRLEAEWNDRNKTWSIRAWVQHGLGVVGYDTSAHTTVPMERADAIFLVNVLRDHLEGRIF